MGEKARFYLRTPRDWWEKLDADHFCFTLDAAADADNALCESYYDEEMDGLMQDWKGTVWVSASWTEPMIGEWVRKARYESITNHATVVMLLPVRTHADWWHDSVMEAAEIWFLTEPLDFKPPPGYRLESVEQHCLVIFRESDGEDGPVLRSYSGQVA